MQGLDLSGPRPQLELQQRIHMGKFAPGELAVFLASAGGDSEMPKNANRWLEAIGARALRKYCYSRDLHRPMPGVLWELENGGLFWTSLDGKFFAYEVLGN